MPKECGHNNLSAILFMDTCDVCKEYVINRINNGYRLTQNYKVGKLLDEARELLNAALPHIECTTTEQDHLITTIGLFLGRK